MFTYSTECYVAKTCRFVAQKVPLSSKDSAWLKKFEDKIKLLIKNSK